MGRRKVEKGIFVFTRLIKKHVTAASPKATVLPCQLSAAKDCVSDTVEHQVIGVIEEVSEGAILLKTESGMQMLNLDFVERIREFPRNKKGKKKSVILD